MVPGPGASDPKLLVQSLTVDPVSGHALAIFVDTRGETAAVELWSWDGQVGSTWTMAGLVDTTWAEGIRFILVPNPNPSSSGGNSMTLLESGGTLYQDITWVCDVEPFNCREAHIDLTDSSSLPFLENNALSFDTSGDGLLAAGGATADGEAIEAVVWGPTDDWAFESPGPSARQRAALGYLPSQDAFLLFGGNVFDAGLAHDVWSYVRDGGWSEVADSTAVSPRQGDTLLDIPDAGSPGWPRGRGLGQGPGLLAPADGGLAVTKLAASAPMGSFGYDPARGRAVIIGPYDTTLWEAAPPSFDSTAVYQGSDVPVEASLIDDAAAGLLVVGGGAANGGALEGQVHRWTGSQLETLPLVDAENDGNPITDTLPVAAYDPAGHRVLLVGSDFAQTVDETWELRFSQTLPALACQFRSPPRRHPRGQPSRSSRSKPWRPRAVLTAGPTRSSLFGARRGGPRWDAARLRRAPWVLREL